MTEPPRNVFVRVLYEARAEFGEPKAWNRAQVTAWVRRRIREIRGEQADVVPFDPKQAATGERE